MRKRLEKRRERGRKGVEVGGMKDDEDSGRSPGDVREKRRSSGKGTTSTPVLRVKDVKRRVYGGTPASEGNGDKYFTLEMGVGNVED